MLVTHPQQHFVDKHSKGGERLLYPLLKPQPCLALGAGADRQPICEIVGGRPCPAHADCLFLAIQFAHFYQSIRDETLAKDRGYGDALTDGLI